MSTAVSPQNWVKARVNELRLSKPTAVAVCCTDWPGAASRAIARSIRACSRYVRQDMPIALVELAAQRALRHRDRAADIGDGHRLQVFLRVGHRGGHDRIRRSRKTQWRFVIQRLGHQMAEGSEEAVGDWSRCRPGRSASAARRSSSRGSAATRPGSAPGCRPAGATRDRTSPPRFGRRGSSSPGVPGRPESRRPAAAAADSARPPSRPRPPRRSRTRSGARRGSASR